MNQIRRIAVAVLVALAAVAAVAQTVEYGRGIVQTRSGSITRIETDQSTIPTVFFLRSGSMPVAGQPCRIGTTLYPYSAEIRTPAAIYFCVPVVPKPPVNDGSRPTTTSSNASPSYVWRRIGF